MRTSLPVLLLTLTACQTSAPTPMSVTPGDGTAVEASFASARGSRVCTDPVAAELLRAAAAAIEHERRLHLENVANVHTNGWKRRVASTTTRDLADADGRTFAMPVVTSATTVFTTGVLETTGRELDLAIDGDGWFAVTKYDGTTAYTRDGHFHVAADGRIVTSRGEILLPEITLATDTLRVAVDGAGRITGRTAGSPDTTTAFGQLNVHRFINPEGLRSEDGSWSPSEASGAPITGTPGTNALGTVKQGVLERSNVDVARELAALDALDRRLEALQRLARHFGAPIPQTPQNVGSR